MFALSKTNTMTLIKNVAKLSKREREILTLISRGLTSRDIAKEIFLSLNTINTHRRNILRKTGAKNTLAVVAIAIQQQTIAAAAVPAS
jgi:DNA-binding CsgD family transcriptional regulator